MSKKLIAFLSSGIKTHRVVYIIISAERNLYVAAVDTAAARINQMLHRMVTTSFKDVVKANDVALYIGIGVLNAIAYARLGSEIHHNVEMIFDEKLVY